MTTYKWLKSTETLTYRIEERVAYVTLNRPEKNNAISQQMQIELQQALLESDDRNDVSVVVLRGAGRNFCAGYDLAGGYGGGGDSELYRGIASVVDDAWQLERGLERRLLLFDMHKPVIGEVQGY